ncbi:TrbC/VirB2 family protein [Caballeronia sp. TF1N1]|uniref:TrbC/VirB2 family protein n=1 Tax=Caballeronia sp. TF1N1 TaxID=2878153 RepID=UPI001FD26181|nr:TrbC/VirB2 family protein [Caballeronia sp. TF1N1]
MKKVKAVEAALFVAFLAVAGAANAAGLDQAGTVLNLFKASLTTIIPVVATLALMLCGLFYAMRMMHKDTFVHWFVGILIVGSATEITALIVG